MKYIKCNTECVGICVAQDGYYKRNNGERKGSNKNMKDKKNTRETWRRQAEYKENITQTLIKNEGKGVDGKNVILHSHNMLP